MNRRNWSRLTSQPLENEVSSALTPAQQADIAANHKHIDDLRGATPDIQRAYYLNEPRANVPPTFLMIRGKADQPGPEVQPGVPEILRPIALEFPAPRRTSLRRLTFARWLVDPANPLTARVIVNRVWQHHFGEGLVRTPSDFGVMGEKPAYPELLDWMAAWFMDHGWSVKQLHRLILGSNAYRMSKQRNAQVLLPRTLRTACYGACRTSGWK